jgi:hypothetical protein
VVANAAAERINARPGNESENSDPNIPKKIACSSQWRRPVVGRNCGGARVKKIAAANIIKALKRMAALNDTVLDNTPNQETITRGAVLSLTDRPADLIT